MLLLLLPALLWLLLLGCFLCGCGCCCAKKPYYYATGGVSFLLYPTDEIWIICFFFLILILIERRTRSHTHTHRDTQNARQVSQILHVYAIYECKPSE